MPKNKVSDPITDQEIAFARLVLSGAMTDRHAAEAVGLNPDSAAYTKSKPRVRAYMLEHRAAVQQQLVQQEADLSRRAVDGLRRLNLDREQVLARLWEIANLSPEMTRGSVTGQVKALSMIVAMENFIPDRRAVSSEKKSPPTPTRPQIYSAAWLGKQQATSIHPQPNPAPPVPPAPARRGAGRGAQQEARREDGPATPACPGVPRSVPGKPKHTPGSAGEAPPNPGPSQSAFANPLSPSQASPVAPYGPGFSFVPDARGPFVPDTRVPFSIKKNPFARPR
jgi:hypothetical protein